MKSSNEASTQASLKRGIYRFSPAKHVQLDKDLFIAEYTSLRSEILQRLSQQTTLYEIAIAAWALILGYALEKIDDKWFNDVILICVYPMLAYLISSGWAFNQIRICQIAQYLRAREETFTDHFGLIWWENYIKDEPGIKKSSFNERPKPLHKHGKVKPAIRIIVGTQLASIIAASIMIFIHFNPDTVHPPISLLKHQNSFFRLAILFLAIDILVTYLSYKLLKQSIGE